MSATQSVPTQHWQAPVLHDAVPRTHFLQLATTHPPPDVDPPLELEELADMQAPALHVPPLCVQSVQEAAPMPQAVSVEPVWQVLVLSQQPVAQLVISHVLPPLPLPLEEVDDPPSSPDPPEEVVLPLLLP